jgi:elongation factor G
MSASTLRPSDIRNVAVVGHKGAGKTSLVEAMLLLSQAAPRAAPRDAQGHFLDDTPEERGHQATLESRLETLRWGSAKINLIDTPGDASALMDTRLALGAVDAALLVVSARDGIQSGTDRVLRWMTEANMPSLIAVTHADDDDARLEELLLELRQRLHLPLAVMSLAARSAGHLDGVLEVLPRRGWLSPPEAPTTRPGDAIPAASQGEVARAREKLVEDVAATDDVLTERYLTDGDLGDDELKRGLVDAVRRRAAIPLFTVAATWPSGILALLGALVELVPPPEEHAGEPLEAYVWKTRIDPHTGRSSYTRVFSGVLHADEQVLNANTGQRERVGQLLEGTGRGAPHVAEAVAGDIVAVTKLKTTHTGETLSGHGHPHVHAPPPAPPRLFSRALQVSGRGAQDRLVAVLERMAEEDPALSFFHDDATHELVLAGLGGSHLDLALERLRRRSSVECKMGPPRIAYRETITRAVRNVEGKQKKQTGGHGQFGVCYVDAQPLERGAGFAFEDAVVGGAVPRQFIGSVEKGILRGLAHGPLGGYAVVDVKVRLIDGKSHSVDSSDAAFQTAGYRAVHAALEAAAPILLEPHMVVEVLVPLDRMGDVIGDLQARGARISGTEGAADTSAIRATAPLAQLLDYEPRLSAMTHGIGTFTMTFSHYDPCAPSVQARIVAESAAARTKNGDDE